MPEICHTFEIAASAETVFDALNSAEGNRAFWTDQTVYQPTVGAVAVFGFGPNRETEFHFRVDTIDRPRHLLWTCVAGPPEWQGTQVDWRLEPLDDQRCRLFFQHLGWATIAGDLGVCSYVWARVLDRLDGWVTRQQRAPIFSQAAAAVA